MNLFVNIFLYLSVCQSPSLIKTIILLTTAGEGGGGNQTGQSPILIYNLFIHLLIPSFDYSIDEFILCSFIYVI